MMASHENNRRHSLRHVSKCIIKQTPSAFPESAERKRTQTRRQMDSRSKLVGMGTQHHQRVHFIVRVEEDLEWQQKARGEPQARAHAASTVGIDRYQIDRSKKALGGSVQWMPTAMVCLTTIRLLGEPPSNTLRNQLDLSTMMTVQEMHCRNLK